MDSKISSKPVVIPNLKFEQQIKKELDASQPIKKVSMPAKKKEIPHIIEVKVPTKKKSDDVLLKGPLLKKQSQQTKIESESDITKLTPHHKRIDDQVNLSAPTKTLQKLKKDSDSDTNLLPKPKKQIQDKLNKMSTKYDHDKILTEKKLSLQTVTESASDKRKVKEPSKDIQQVINKRKLDEIQTTNTPIKKLSPIVEIGSRKELKEGLEPKKEIIQSKPVKIEDHIDKIQTLNKSPEITEILTQQERKKVIQHKNDIEKTFKTKLGNSESKNTTYKMKDKPQNKKVEPVVYDLSRKPTNTRFHQQRMDGWTPSFEPRFISRAFIGVAMCFLIIGSITIILTLGIDDLSFDYTDCKDIYDISCAEKMNNRSYTDHFSYCQCNYSFKIRKLIKAPIYFYYSLGNYYQNHRRFLSSRDDYQLHGDSLLELDKNCEPLLYQNNSIKKKYAPCGLVANSKFNDTFRLMYMTINGSIPVSWSNNNIAWSSDKNVIFGRPKNWNNTVKPENWKLSAQKINPNAYSGDEDFIVWMKAAPLQYFRKLHRIIYSGGKPFDVGLPKGNYTLMINYAYPITSFFGTKAVYFSTTTFLGGKNIFMSIAFLIVSAILFILGMLLVYYEMYTDPTVMQNPAIAVTKVV